MSRPAHPARPYSPLVVSPAIIATWWLVAHDSGAGWMQALGDLVFGALFVGVLGPAMILRRTRLEVVRVPTDSVAGQHVEVVIHASSRVRVQAVEPASLQAFLGPVGRRGLRDDQLTLTPEHRGVYETIICDVATAAPFGLQWWTRRLVVPLPTPLLIAPRSGVARTIASRENAADGEAAERTRPDSGQPRGARPYKAGDSRRLVHWPASAHAGELMVRELEASAIAPVDVDVVLPRGRDEAERVAEQALATIVKLLDQGSSVRLRTLEASGAVSGVVGDRRTGGRRLARAVSESEESSRQSGVETTA